MKQLATYCIIISICSLFSFGCSSGIEGGFFPDYGLKEGDVIRIEITGTFKNAQWTEGQLYKTAALDTGTTMQLSLVGYDIEGNSNSTLSATWSTSDQKVAAVDNTGNITAISAGVAEITVKLVSTITKGVISDTIVVTVLPSPVTGNQWTLSTTSLPQAIWDHASAIWNGHLYVAGGHSSCTAVSYKDCGFTDNVYYAPISKTDGSIGKFIQTTTLPDYLRGHSLLAYNGYLYIIGGIVQPTFPEPPYPDPANFETILNEKVYYAKVNADGSLGKWEKTASLPPPEERDPPIADDKAGLFALSATVHTISKDGKDKGYIYVTGGWSAELKKNVKTVLVGPITDVDEPDAPTGSIKKWIHNDLSDLPDDYDGLSKHTSVTASVNGNNYIYVIGGNSGNYGSQIFHNEILYAKVAEDGILTETEKDGIRSTWHYASASLHDKLIDHASVSIGRYMFVLGGRNGVEGSNDEEEYKKFKEVVYFYIDDTGDLQSLQRIVDLPEPLFHHAAVADKNITANSISIYLTGGAGGNSAYPDNRKNTVYHFKATQ